MSKAIDPRVTRTHALLLDALLQLLATRKLHHITVQEIARVAGLNRATFYAHFYDKYALYRRLVRNTFLDTLSRYLDPDERLIADRIPALVTGVFDYFAFLNRSCPSTDRDLRPLAETEIQAVLESRFSTLCSDESAGAEIDSRFASWALFGVAMDTPPDMSAHERDALIKRTASTITRVVGVTDS